MTPARHRGTAARFDPTKPGVERRELIRIVQGTGRPLAGPNGRRSSRRNSRRSSRRRSRFTPRLLAAGALLLAAGLVTAQPPSPPAEYFGGDTEPDHDRHGSSEPGGLARADCPHAFNRAQTYSIDATSTNQSDVTVDPAASPHLNCGSGGASFTLTATCAAIDSSTEVDFTPIAGPPDLQSKLAGTSVDVRVTNHNNACDNVAPTSSNVTWMRGASTSIRRARALLT